MPQPPDPKPQPLPSGGRVQRGRSPLWWGLGVPYEMGEVAFLLLPGLPSSEYNGLGSAAVSSHREKAVEGWPSGLRRLS